MYFLHYCQLTLELSLWQECYEGHRQCYSQYEQQLNSSLSEIQMIPKTIVKNFSS